ncbi:hypothetical protein L208DRAFT_1455853 [Tricholoma matsutake]|nr:hypothetical protein L208DRAFT_1455853 [Tricholoma matsutake 945]
MTNRLRLAIRSAKSGSDWSDNELLAFNIQVVDTTITVFFNTPELPPPTVAPTILNNIDKPDGPLVKGDRLFFQYMRLVEKPRSPESRVDDFAAFILRILNYDNKDRIICQRTEMSFPMTGHRVDAKTDVCLMDELELLLLVQEDKRTSSNDDPEPQVIVEAIAAFYQNNLQCKQMGLQPLQSKYIPAITMIGTAPIFYHIPVTTALVQALATASYPQEETTVLKFIPPVPNQHRYRIDGMWPLDNQHIILQCFEAFKAVINCRSQNTSERKSFLLVAVVSKPKSSPAIKMMIMGFCSHNAFLRVDALDTISHFPVPCSQEAWSARVRRTE